MKLTIATCCHERPFVTALFLLRCEALKKYAAQKYGIRMAVVMCLSIGDEEKAKTIIHCGSVAWIDTEDNTMIGAKWNRSVEMALDTHPDYVVICGDDDLLLNSWLDAVVDSIGMVGPHFDQEQWSGVTTAYAINEDGRAALLQYENKKIMGSGCLIRSDVLRMVGQKIPVIFNKGLEGVEHDGEQWLRAAEHEYLKNAGYVSGEETMQFRLWEPSIARALDLHRDLQLARMGFVCNHIATPTPTIVAIKTDRSIRKWDHMVGYGWTKPAEFDPIFALLSDDEQAFYNEHIRA